MNPRNRRLVLPGLLAGLVLVVAVVSFWRQAQAAEPSSPPSATVSRLSDPRISESSGLAISRAHRDLAYTVNDSGHEPVIYAVRISTGQTVGTTTVKADLVDVEALALDSDGTLWIADTGDNRLDRDHATLLTIAEPGEATQTVEPTEYRVRYDTGPTNVETLLVDQKSHRKYLISKGGRGGDVFALPQLHADEVATLHAGGTPVAPFATDGSVTPDGRFAVVRNDTDAYVYDLADWSARGNVVLPVQPQGETLSVEASGASYLIGSEGAGSTLIRVPLTVGAATPAALVGTRGDAGNEALPWMVGVFLAAVAVAGLWWFGRSPVR